MSTHEMTAIDTAGVRDLHEMAGVKELDDGLIKSLSSALEAAKQGCDQNCAEALRLAIAIRLGRLHSQPLKPTAQKRGRQVRLLQKWRLRRVVEYVDNHFAAKISLADLAAVAGLSRMHFASQFRAATGLRPHEYLLKRRILRAEELLRDSTTTIVEIALTVGFQTQAHFTTVFKRFVGSTPRHWRTVNQMPTLPRIGSGARVDAAPTA